MTFKILPEAVVLLLGGCASLMGVWVRMAWPAIGGLAVYYACLVVIVASRRDVIRHRGLALAWVFSAVVAVTIAFGREFFTFDSYYVVLAGMNATAALLAASSSTGRAKSWGQLLMLVWGWLGACVLLANAYLQNWRASFHIGLGLVLLLLVLGLPHFRPGRFGLQAVATWVLLIVGLPVADLFYRPAYQSGRHIELSKEYYSYEAARKDPAAFAHWWNCYLKEWDSMARQIFERDPSGKRPFRLRPNSRGKLFESTIFINSKGIRGPEIPDDHSDVYRIIALGESTTFGCTLRQEDRSWPEALEHLIRAQFQPARPVQVINAGVPAHNVQHNLLRLREELLALKPDMIISYHGINGFFLLDQALPRASGRPPPAFKPRPLRLLADCEYRTKMILYRRRQTAKLILHAPKLAEPLKTEYAQAYRELIDLCRSNEVRLVIGNFSLAVNSQSDLDVAEFYRTAAPSVHWLVRANAAHSVLVEQLAEQFPDVVFVDTHPQLDGHPQMFIDLGHLTQAGREQIARNFFNSIRRTLESDLAPR